MILLVSPTWSTIAETHAGALIEHTLKANRRLSAEEINALFVCEKVEFYALMIEAGVPQDRIAWALKVMIDRFQRQLMALEAAWALEPGHA